MSLISSARYFPTATICSITGSLWITLLPFMNNRKFLKEMKGVMMIFQSSKTAWRGDGSCSSPLPCRSFYCWCPRPWLGWAPKLSTASTLSLAIMASGCFFWMPSGVRFFTHLLLFNPRSWLCDSIFSVHLSIMNSISVNFGFGLGFTKIGLSEPNFTLCGWPKKTTLHFVYRIGSQKAIKQKKKNMELLEIMIKNCIETVNRNFFYSCVIISF